VLPAAIHAVEMERGLICPPAQGGEAAWAGGLRGGGAAEPAGPDQPLQGHADSDAATTQIAEDKTNHLDLRDIKGQRRPSAALEVAAAVATTS